MSMRHSEESLSSLHAVVMYLRSLDAGNAVVTTREVADGAMVEYNRASAALTWLRKKGIIELIGAVGNSYVHRIVPTALVAYEPLRARQGLTHRENKGVSGSKRAEIVQLQTFDRARARVLIDEILERLAELDKVIAEPKQPI